MNSSEKQVFLSSVCQRGHFGNNYTSQRGTRVYMGCQGNYGMVWLLDFPLRWSNDAFASRVEKFWSELCMTLRASPAGDRGLLHDVPRWHLRPRCDILTGSWGGVCWPVKVPSTGCTHRDYCTIVTLNLGYSVIGHMLIGDKSVTFRAVKILGNKMVVRSMLKIASRIL